MNIGEYNRRAWDSQVKRCNKWTIPVTSEQVAAARRGEWSIVLTAERAIPREWFPPLDGLATLCLAGSGGQQAPILAAAGAQVTVLDNSPAQLGQDRAVADRDGLTITTVLGDMRNLSAFADETFGLIVHPCSNGFVPDVLPVWREAARVLRPGGVLLSGFLNPAVFVFPELGEKPTDLTVRYRLPYSDTESLSDEDRAKLIADDEPLIFSHTLAELIGGQCEAGLSIVGMYEDGWPDHAVGEFMPAFVATRAIKVSA